MSNGANQTGIKPAQPKRPSEYARGLAPVAAKFFAPVMLVGRQVQSWDGKTEKYIELEIDEESRRIWVKLDTGGNVDIGWTPFENVQSISYGRVATPGQAAAE